MNRVVAGIYEIQQQIGSGGGGVVYLGRHLRLNKLVVLKADKRSLNTKPEILRREVDMLKKLSHTYIPQVYDFVQEDGIVYTVMDYIDGESLDQVLKRGALPPQSQLIQWACQLLEALCYLHSQPPHGILHADIKPANIMLRPNGDICLIDYNIALALGENGAVKVGYSQGYASPEHYGVEGASQIPGVLPESGTGTGSSTGSTKSRKSVMLDVRSDIYSLGATLYHLISGRRPPKDPAQLEPLGPECCSPSVAAIIQKAMAREPERRYQTAEEMLTAFRQLPLRDKRVLRRKRRIRLVAGILILMFLAGGACTFVGLKRLERRQEALTLAEYSADELAKGNVSGAVKLALQAIPTGTDLLEAPVTAEARKALTDALGVYDLSDNFQPWDTVELPSAPYQVKLSADGASLAAVCQGGLQVFHTESRRQQAALPITNSALADAIFVDENRILYAGVEGVTIYDLEKERTLWTGAEATTLALSGDRMRVAAVNRNEGQAFLYDAEDGSLLAECGFHGKQMETAYNDIFANPDNRVFALNQDGTMLAVSFSDGGLTIFDLKNPDDDLIVYETSEYPSFEGGFCGKYFAFVARKSDQSLFGVIDTEEAVYAGKLESRKLMRMKTDEKGIWLSEGNLLVCFDPETLEDTEMAFTDQRNIVGFGTSKEYLLVATDDPGFSFYDSGANEMAHEETEEACDFMALAADYAVLANRDQPSLRLLRLESHEETQILSYDARYEHDEARLLDDGGSAMLFNYEGFRIYKEDGTLLAEGSFPDADQIYDQQYRRENGSSWLEVIWYDGTVRCYRAEDGTLFSEEKRDAPSKDLYEEFFTEHYRFASELHGTPQVYDRETGMLVAELEKDAYLTYVTEVGEYIVTEYMSAAGERYGLLLDKELQTLAKLPQLCDIVDGQAVFDYETGDLRQCRLYSLQELVALGEAYKQ